MTFFIHDILNLYDTICEMLKPKQKWGKAMKCVNHPHDMAELHWKIKPLLIHHYGLTEPNVQSPDTSPTSNIIQHLELTGNVQSYNIEAILYTSKCLHNLNLCKQVA